MPALPSAELTRQNRPQITTRLSTVLALAVVATILLASTQSARADEKTRRIVGGVLRLLIESQRPQRGPQPPMPPASREVVAVQEVLSDYRDEAARLSQIAQRDVGTSTGLRPLISDVLTFHASAESVFHRARHMSHPAQMRQSVAQLDGNWRVLSWRLKQTRGVSRECRSSVETLDLISGKLCELYDLQPQIDRRSLQRHADSLTIYSRSLVEDLDIELRRSPHRRQIILEASKAHQATIVFADDVARQASYARLVASYKSFVALWGPLARRVCLIDSRFVERNVLRIQDTDQAIHELLWLPRGIDRQLLGQLTTGILSEVDRIYVAVNLNVLIQLPNAEEVPGAASDFYGCCQHFADCVQRDESEDELVDAYSYLPDAWVSFSRLFRTLDHPEIRQSLSEIEQRLVALRDPLRIPGGFSHDELRERVATLEHHVEHLTEDLDDWLRGDRTFEKDRRDLVELGRRLQSEARVLHLAALQNTPGGKLQELAETVVVRWEELHTRIQQCEATNRDHIRELQSRISRELIGIEAMFL